MISGPKYEPATSKVGRTSAVYFTITIGMLALEVVTLERSNDLNKRQVWLLTRQAMYVQLNIHGRSVNNCCHRQVMGIAYSEYVFLALFPRYTKHIRGILLSSMACLALQYFSTLSHKRHDVWNMSPYTKYLFDLLHKFM